VDPVAIALDSSRDIYAANAGSIVEFAAGQSGNISPIATISGSNTKLISVGGMARDAAGNIYVTNVTNAITTNILEFPAGANGNVAPIAVLNESGNTSMTPPQGIAIGPGSEIFVVHGNSNPGGAGSVNVYAATNATASNPAGTLSVTPTTVISGLSTGIVNPFGIALYPNGDIYVVNSSDNTITIFGSGTSGNMAPKGTISGGNTGLNDPGFTSAMFPAAFPEP